MSAKPLKLILGTLHIVGADADSGCDACYSDAAIAECGCGGSIHNDFFDESHDSVYLNYECDQCGSTASPEELL